MIAQAYDLFLKYHGIYLAGLSNTLSSAALGLVFSLVVGLLAGVVRFMSAGAAGRLVAAYVSVVRNTPMMVQVYFIYFGLPIVGIKLSAYETGIVALTFHTGAYIAEIVRGGLTSISRGQIEAARSLGLGHADILRMILLPQAAPMIMPPITGQFVQLIKDTSILYTISVLELTKAANNVGNETYQFLEAFLVAWVFYVALCIVLNVIVDIYESRAGFNRHRRA